MIIIFSHDYHQNVIAGPGGDYYCDANHVNDNWWAIASQFSSMNNLLRYIYIVIAIPFSTMFFFQVPWIRHLGGQQGDGQCPASHLRLCGELLNTYFWFGMGNESFQFFTLTPLPLHCRLPTTTLTVTGVDVEPTLVTESRDNTDLVCFVLFFDIFKMWQIKLS